MQGRLSVIKMVDVLRSWLKISRSAWCQLVLDATLVSVFQRDVMVRRKTDSPLKEGIDVPRNGRGLALLLVRWVDDGPQKPKCFCGAWRAKVELPFGQGRRSCIFLGQTALRFNKRPCVDPDGPTLWPYMVQRLPYSPLCRRLHYTTHACHHR